MGQDEQKIEYHDIILTDFQLHVSKPRKPISWYRAFIKAIRSKMPGRAYTQDFQINKDGTGKVIFSLPLETQKEMEAAKNSGKKIRILMPKGGIPIYPGKDLMEKLVAMKKISKRYLNKK